MSHWTKDNTVKKMVNEKKWMFFYCTWQWNPLVQPCIITQLNSGHICQLCVTSLCSYSSPHCCMPCLTISVLVRLITCFVTYEELCDVTWCNKFNLKLNINPINESQSLTWFPHSLLYEIKILQWWAPNVCIPHPLPDQMWNRLPIPSPVQKVVLKQCFCRVNA